MILWEIKIFYTKIYSSTLRNLRIPFFQVFQTRLSQRKSQFNKVCLWDAFLLIVFCLINHDINKCSKVPHKGQQCLALHEGPCSHRSNFITLDQHFVGGPDGREMEIQASEDVPLCQLYCFLSSVLGYALFECWWRSLSVLSFASPRSSSQLTIEKWSDVVSRISPSALEPLKQKWLTGLLQSFYVVTRTVSIFCHFFALAMIMLLPQKCICFKGNNTD